MKSSTENDEPTRKLPSTATEEASLVKDRNAKVLPSWRQSRIASADPKRPRPTAEIDEESRDIERTLSELPSWRQSITDSE
jgi:hypothetical protein